MEVHYHAHTAPINMGEKMDTLFLEILEKNFSMRE